MRFLLLLPALILTTVTQDEGELRFSQIVNIPGKSKAEIYEAITDYVVFDSDIVLMRDDGTGNRMSLLAHYEYDQGFLTGRNLTEGFVKFRVDIEIKEEEYSVIFRNFEHHSYNSEYYSAGVMQKSFEWPGWTGMEKNWRNRVYQDILFQLQDYTDKLKLEMEQKVKE